MPPVSNAARVGARATQVEGRVPQQRRLGEIGIPIGAEFLREQRQRTEASGRSGVSSGSTDVLLKSAPDAGAGGAPGSRRHTG